MFKNRAVQVTMVKKSDLEPTEPTPDTTEIVADATEAVEKVMGDVTKLVLLYVAADTLRKVIVALVTK